MCFMFLKQKRKSCRSLFILHVIQTYQLQMRVNQVKQKLRNFPFPILVYWKVVKDVRHVQDQQLTRRKTQKLSILIF